MMKIEGTNIPITFKSDSIWNSLRYKNFQNNHKTIYFQAVTNISRVRTSLCLESHTVFSILLSSHKVYNTN